MSDGTNSATYTYLANSRLVSQILYKQNTTTRMTTRKQYDLLNRLHWINSTPSGANTAPFYYGFIYNDANQRTRMTTADGSFWVYGYDSLGQVISGKKYWADGVPVEGEQMEYVFDDIGNRKSTKEGGDQFGQNLRSASYTNNTLNQITGRGVPGYANITGISTATNEVTVNSNNADYRRGSFYREELAISNSSTNPVWTAITVSADTTTTGNLLTPPAGQTFWYDADGNLTNDLVWRYIWDGENRLVEVQPLTNAPADSKKWLTFSYDWQGRRISKTAKWWTNSAWTTRTSNKLLYDGWNLIGELNATNNNLLRGYIWGTDLSGSIQGAGGVGGLIAVNDVDTGTHFAAFDGNGNVMGTTKSDGAVTGQYEYDPFGQTVRMTGSYASINPIRFSTKYCDHEINLYYYGYRYYVPSAGVWLNRDPIEEKGGINLIAFVNNNPIALFDSLGLASGDTVGATIEACLQRGGEAAISCLEAFLESTANQGQKNLINHYLRKLRKEAQKCLALYQMYKKACEVPGCGGADGPGLTLEETLYRAMMAHACAQGRRDWVRKCACKGFMGGVASSAFHENHWAEVGKATAKATSCYHLAMAKGWKGEIPSIN